MFMRDASGQTLQRARIRHDPQRHFRQAELDMFRRNQQVTGHGHFEPTANGQPVDGSNDWLIERPVFGQPGESAKTVIITLPPVVQLHLASIQRLEVPACGKDLVAAAGQDRDPQFGIVMQFPERRCQRL